MGKQKREREEACPICQHYHDFMGGERCGICGHMAEVGDCAAPSTLPSELVPGFLFLGSYDHASRADLLKTLGITHVLNTVPTAPNLYRNSFEYHVVATQPPCLEECAAFLDSVRTAEKKVLVHCMTGNNRAPTVALYYLMRGLGWNLQQAYAHVITKRPAVAITEVDCQRLAEAEVQLLGPMASGFRVPVGKQQLLQQQGVPAAQPFGGLPAAAGGQFAWRVGGGGFNPQ